MARFLFLILLFGMPAAQAECLASLPRFLAGSVEHSSDIDSLPEDCRPAVSLPLDTHRRSVPCSMPEDRTRQSADLLEFDEDITERLRDAAGFDRHEKVVVSQAFKICGYSSDAPLHALTPIRNFPMRN